jgi:short subunit dehydrogenase-like uncharacterized protein
VDDYLIYGANGYTGALIARTARARGHRPLLGGRNREAVTTLATRLGLEARVFALDDASALRNGLRGCGLVLHCAGPFARTYRAVAEACLQERVHYLDVTGEIAVFEGLAARDSAARAAGVMLLPGVGFDVVPSDCLALHLKQRLPGATHLALGFQSSGRLSRGTATTMLENLHRGGWIRRAGVLTAVPPAWRTRVIDFGTGPQVAMTIPWGDVSTAYYSTGIPNIEVYLAAAPAQRTLARLLRNLGWLVASKWVQQAMRRRIQAGPAGPTDEERARGQTLLWGEARAGAGTAGRVLAAGAGRIHLDGAGGRGDRRTGAGGAGGARIPDTGAGLRGGFRAASTGGDPCGWSRGIAAYPTPHVRGERGRKPPVADQTWGVSPAQGLAETGRQGTKTRPVIILTAADDLVRLIAAIDVSDAAGGPSRTGSVLVGQEVVLQPIHDRLGQFAYVVPLAIRGIFDEHGDDLVVGIVAVYQPETADRQSAHQDVAMRDGLFGEHADIQWIAISLDVLGSVLGGAELRHPVAAIRLRNQPIQGRADVGVQLRAIDPQQPADLVQFVLDRVGRHHLDVGGHLGRRFRTDRHAVPGMGAQPMAQKHPDGVA